MNTQVIKLIVEFINPTKWIYCHHNCKIGWLVQAYITFILGTEKKIRLNVRMHRVAVTVPFVPFLYEIFKNRWI